MTRQTNRTAGGDREGLMLNLSKMFMSFFEFRSLTDAIR